MAAAERVNKFYDDSLIIINQCQTKSNNTKLYAEIIKLKTWLQKHQNEILPDGHKGKLLQTLEVYNKYCTSSSSIFEKEKVADSVLDLLSDYLQLPEGRLVSASYKKKVLNWREILLGGMNDSSSVGKSSGTRVTRWTVEGVDSSAQTVSLLNLANQELWKEDHHIPDKAKFQSIETMHNQANEEGKNVMVEVDEGNQTIVSFTLSD